MTNNTNAAIAGETVVGMESIPVIKEEEITKPGGKKMKVNVKRDMKKLVKPAMVFGAGAATCFVGMKVVPAVMAKHAAAKATEAVVDTAVDVAVTTAADVMIATAATAAAALL